MEGARALKDRNGGGSMGNLHPGEGCQAHPYPDNCTLAGTRQPQPGVSSRTAEKLEGKQHRRLTETDGHDEPVFGERRPAVDAARSLVLPNRLAGLTVER